MQRLRLWIQSNPERFRTMVNRGLSDKKKIAELAPSIIRNTNGKKPKWLPELMLTGTVSTTNGKTLGSIVEKIVAAVIEVDVAPLIPGMQPPHVRINPADGVDLPDLSLGVKSPSENWDTSEPFFSPWERLAGNNHDNICLLTNLQRVKHEIPFTLSIISVKYLRGDQLSDKILSGIARIVRESNVFSKEEFLQICRFLCIANKRNKIDSEILKKLKNIEPDESARSILDDVKHYLESATLGPLIALNPTEIQRSRLLEGPFDGQISMSFALQWRYTFRGTFD